MNVVDMFLIVAMVTEFWLIIGLQVKLKLTRDELLSFQHRVLLLEKGAHSSGITPD